VIEVNEGVLRPQLLPKFFAGQNFARTFEQENQYAERLIRQAQAHTGLAEFASLGVRFKGAEPEVPRRMLGSHGKTS
jgi:hypothetical protein